MCTPSFPFIRLLALNGGPDILLGDRPLLTGRHPRCDVRLPSLRVSRQHCCLARAGPTVWVRDLGSTNGVRINGQRIREGSLAPGDELAIAHFRYLVEFPPPAANSWTMAGTGGIIGAV